MGRQAYALAWGAGLVAAYSASVTGALQVPAATAYMVIADYRTHHPRILPDSFKSLDVVEGGVGAGTILDVVMEVAGRESRMRLHVTEPEPGKVLVERDEAGTVTTFTVTPQGPDSCTVTIATTWVRAPGLKGWLDARIVPTVARRIYRDELKRLEAYAQGLPRR